MIFQEEAEGQVFLCPSLHESESSVSYFLDARRVSLRDRACSLYPHSALAQLHWAPAARRLRDTLCSYSASWYPASFLVFQSHSIFEKKKKSLFIFDKAGLCNCIQKWKLTFDIRTWFTWWSDALGYPALQQCSTSILSN